MMCHVATSSGLLFRLFLKLHFQVKRWLTLSKTGCQLASFSYFISGFANDKAVPFDKNDFCLTYVFNLAFRDLFLQPRFMLTC